MDVLFTTIKLIKLDIDVVLLMFLVYCLKTYDAKNPRVFISHFLVKIITPRP